MYIHVDSNHPSNIIKAIPDNIARRISNISSNKEIFDAAAPYYNNALSASGYVTNITYTPNPPVRNKNRSRKVIWFNPPFNRDVKTDIARKFLRLVTKHFPKTHKLHKIFNKNNVKVSYGCMPSVANIINAPGFSVGNLVGVLQITRLGASGRAIHTTCGSLIFF